MAVEKIHEAIKSVLDTLIIFYHKAKEFGGLNKIFWYSRKTLEVTWIWTRFGPWLDYQTGLISGCARHGNVPIPSGNSIMSWEPSSRYWLIKDETDVPLKAWAEEQLGAQRPTEKVHI